MSSDKINTWSTSRRQLFRLAGGGGIAGLAGYTGSTDNGDNSSGGGQTTTKEGEYPDLSGEEVHFLTDRTTTRVRKVLNEFVEDFQSTTGASVNFEVMGKGGTAQNRLSQLLQAGTPPDAFSGMEDVSALSFANQGLLADHNQHLELLSDQVGAPNEEILLEVDGQPIYLPTITTPSIIWYRSDIWGNQPINPNWDEFATLVEENNGKQGLPSYYALRAEETCTDLWTAFYASGHGAKISTQVDGEFRSTVGVGENRDKWIDTFEFLKRIGQSSPRNSDAGCKQAIAALRTESTSAVGYAGSRPKQTVVDADMDIAAEIKGMRWPAPEGSDENLYKTYKGWINFNTVNVSARDTFTDLYIKEGYYEKSISAEYPSHVPVIPAVTESNPFTQRRQEILDGP
jgi:ABC-type glycerol-3-phosphate transport system substrate-binding protein